MEDMGYGKISKDMERYEVCMRHEETNKTVKLQVLLDVES